MANDNSDTTNDCNNSADVPASGTNRISMKQSNTFPFRLHEMLDTVEKEGSESIVSWCSDSTAFRVHKPQEFVKSIMPRFFQQTKYKSFQRQCNLWGYERILHGPEKGGYEHPDGFFVKGNPSLVNKMVRRKIKRRPSTKADDGEGSITPTTHPAPFLPSTTLPPAATCVGSTGTVQRRPSIVSLSSNHSGSSSDVLVMAPQPYYTQNGSAGIAPSTPMTSSCYGSSVETTPHDAAEGLYLPPPPSAGALAAAEQQQQYQQTEEDGAAGDMLFMEGLSAFFEDEEISSIISSELPDAPSLSAPLQSNMPTHSVAAVQQRLQPKRRLSMELFMASRQQNSNEMILDLLSESDTLQKSLEMELMCSVGTV